MKASCLALLAAAAPFFGESAELPRAPVGIYFEYQLPPGEYTVSLIQSDVQAILSPLGFDIQWRPARPGGTEFWSDLAFVSFQGRCNPGIAPFGKFLPGALGWTHAIDGEIQPFVEIDCSRIGALLESQAHLPGAQKPERLFARAVARVVAHELYHVFAKTNIHETSGVGKPEFSVRDLLSEDFRFDSKQARALRKRSAAAARLFLSRRDEVASPLMPAPPR